MNDIFPVVSRIRAMLLHELSLESLLKPVQQLYVLPRSGQREIHGPFGGGHDRPPMAGFVARNVDSSPDGVTGPERDDLQV